MADVLVSDSAAVTPEHLEMLAALQRHEHMGGEHYVYVRRKTLPEWLYALRKVLWLSVQVYEGSHTGADNDWYQLFE